MFYSSADRTAHHSHVADALKDWMKDSEIVKQDLARLKECLADRGKDGCCPVPEKF